MDFWNKLYQNIDTNDIVTKTKNIKVKTPRVYCFAGQMMNYTIHFPNSTMQYATWMKDIIKVYKLEMVSNIFSL